MVTPETTRNLAVTLKVGERTDDRAEAETGGEIELGILEMRGCLGFGDLFSRSSGTNPISSGEGVDSRLKTYNVPSRQPRTRACVSMSCTSLGVVCQYFRMVGNDLDILLSKILVVSHRSFSLIRRADAAGKVSGTAK